LFALVCCCLLPDTAAAQLADFNVQLLNEGDGIRTSNILKMVRDKKGFLWMLSPRYIQRFDGHSVKRFEAKGEDLLDITSDQEGQVWVSSQSAVKKYVNDYKGFEDVSISVPANTKLNVLQISQDNKLWVISGIGLFRYDNKSCGFIRHEIPALSNILFYRKIFRKYQREFFIGNTHELFSYNPVTGRVRRVPFEGVTAIAAFSEDILWVTNTRMQVFELNFETGNVKLLDMQGFRRRPRPDFLEIGNIVPAGTTGKYLITTNEGCYWYDRATGLFDKMTLYHFGNEIANNEVYTSHYDHEGTLWLLGQPGILFFRPGEHTISWLRGYNDPSSDWNNNVKAIAGDDSGHIWMATAGGISRLNPVTGKVRTYLPTDNPKGTFRFPSVQGLVFDGKNLLLGPGEGGPALFDIRTETFKPPQYPAGPSGKALKEKLGKDYIYAIHTLVNGNQLVLGDLGCYLIEKRRYLVSELHFDGADYILQTAAQDHQQNLWIGTYKGLLYLDKTFKTIGKIDTLGSSRIVTALLVKNDSTVLAGSVGLFEVTKTAGGLRKRAVIPELANQQITMLYGDLRGRIWIGADDGLYCYNPQNRRLDWYDIMDNMQNKALNPGSLFRAKNGILYLGGNNGLNYFNPELIDSPQENLNVLLTGVVINQDDSLYLARHADEKPVPRGRNLYAIGHTPLDLNWHQNSVEIQYVTPYFRNTQKLRYRYRLFGLDSGWVSNGRNNSVRFSSLAPGNYRFSVAASLDGFTWYELRQPFLFSIAPPFWKEPWFILAAFCVMVGTGYLLFKRRVQLIQRREAEVYALQTKANALEKEKALAMYEGLKQQLNPHFLFNSLTSLDSLIFIDPKVASSFLSGLSRTYRYILKNRDNEVVALKEEMEFARQYIHLQKTRFREGLIVNIDIDPECAHMKIAPVTLQNLIENAIKHNIIDTEAPLVIDIFTEQERLVVRNGLRKKDFVETSNRQGLKNLESLYTYLSSRPLEIIEDEHSFTVKLPLI
jgi:ligand-binding sensor domain-containing protein